MKLFRTLIVLIGFLFISALIATPAHMRGYFRVQPISSNSPPIANDDFYTVHRSLSLDNGFLANDSDPDGDPFSVSPEGWRTGAHGSLFITRNGGFVYNPTFGYIGTDTYTYTICDDKSACSTATVTFNVVNTTPVTASDTYAVHRRLSLDRALLSNDSDPDGDTFSIFPEGWRTGAHGQLFLVTSGGFVYNPTFGYTGSDTYTYDVCDSWGGCSTSTVTFNVVNSAPITVDKAYFTHGSFSRDRALLVGNSDPDGDPFSISPEGWRTGAHGQLFLVTSGGFVYNPNSGFVGSDSYTFSVCDDLGECTDQIVTFYVVENGDGVNDGANSCKSVGEPINVTNGNMYIQQSDYSLRSVGPAIDVTRTFNSNSQRIGLFGRGWSTAYDESIRSYDANLVRLDEGDGRATYFARSGGSSGTFAPLQPDFQGQFAQNGSGAFTLTLTDGSVRQFNSGGKLLSLADRNGNQTTLSYDANGNLTSITDPFGRVLTLTTNANGQVISVSDSMGVIASYAYGSSNKLLTVTYADGSGFQFGYDGANRLITVTDALGNIVEAHTYDGQGRALTSEKHGGVERYTLSYVSGTETNVTDALGRLTKYTFDGSKGRNVLTKVEGVCSCGGGGGSQVQTWAYDNQLNVTSRTDALNHTTTFTYDGNGNQLTQTDATGTVTYTYNQFSEVLTRTDQLNGVTANTYDAQGNLLAAKDALNNTTTFTYSPRGQVLTSTDARGKVTNFTYDASGNLTQKRDANGITTFYFYDARRRLTKVRDGFSRSTLYAYDAAGRVNKVTRTDNSFVTLTYDLAGRRTVVRDERGNPTTFAYDSAYRMTSVTDALGQVIAYGYDAMSNLTSKTDALSRTTNYDYDDFNRLGKITYPAATSGAPRLFETFSYNAAGQVTHRKDTAGRVTSYAYDSANRVTGMTDADNKTTGFEYDALSRVTALVDALNQRYQFAYDAVGRPTQITRGGASMSYAYDAVGNRVQRTDYNGTVTNYTYDNLNRLTTTTYPTRAASYVYDPLGNLTRVTNENGVINIGYDSRYRVSSFNDPFFYGISYNYDAAGNRTKLSLNGATYATYAYDAANRMTSLKDGANQDFPHNYDAANRLTSRGAPNGVTTSFAYDNLDRLTGLAHVKGTTTLINNQYQYNDANNITSWANAAGNHTYAYDTLDRLTSATNSAQPNESYSYNAAGNRTSSHASPTYGYGPFNKLTTTAIASYSYDNNGNLISKTDSSGTITFSWNEENQLRQVTLPDGQSVNYKYDGLGRRIQRTTSAGADTRFVYDGKDVLLDLNADWSVAMTYLNGPGIDNHLRQTNSGGGALYYLTDHLGSTSGLTDPSGNVVELPSYDSFGNSAGSLVTRYDYTGRERDPLTGLIYYRARWYDPQAGRFISEDPIGLKAGINFYTYVDNRPLLFRDPEGLAPWDYALFLYYAHYCLQAGLECKQYCQIHFDRAPLKWAEIHPQYSSPSEQAYFECFAVLPDCQNMLYYGTKAGVSELAGRARPDGRNQFDQGRLAEGRDAIEPNLAIANRLV